MDLCKGWRHHGGHTVLGIMPRNMSIFSVHSNMYCVNEVTLDTCVILVARTVVEEFLGFELKGRLEPPISNHP